jgi:hypothetical protein
MDDRRGGVGTAAVDPEEIENGTQQGPKERRGLKYPFEISHTRESERTNERERERKQRAPGSVSQRHVRSPCKTDSNGSLWCKIEGE